MTVDLAERAERRAAFAALAGALLLSEPGKMTAPLVARVPQLASLADESLAVEYERIFLRSVSPYESVFRSDSAERGGAVAARVTDFFDDTGFDEHRTNRWRVAGADHLGLQLRAHAFLVGLEAAAWRGERPDEGARHVEAQRRLFAEHVGWWAQVALDAMAVVAVETGYAQLLGAVSEFLVEEVELLRPLPYMDVTQLPTQGSTSRLGPRRLARHMLAPARCGFWLGSEDIAASARLLGFPWRPMDSRQNLVPLVNAAYEAGEIEALVTPWVSRARDAARTYSERASSQAGAELAWRHLGELAAQTAELLVASSERMMSASDDDEVVLRVSGSNAGSALDALRAQGFDAEVIVD